MGLRITICSAFNVHYPTDSSLLGDGARVLTRTMKKIQAEVGRAGTQLRDRMRSVQHRLIEIGRAARGRNEKAKERQQQVYRKLMSVTRKVVAQSKIFAREVRRGVKQAADWKRQIIVDALARRLEEVGALTR